MRYHLVVAVGTLVFAIWTGAVVPVGAKQRLGEPEYLAHFNLPRVDGSGKIIEAPTLHARLLAYINGARPSSQIRGHIASMGCSHEPDAIG